MPPILDDPFPLGDDELSKKLAARRAALQQSYNANALEAEATPELSGTQVGASAAIKLLPLLLGMAIAKRRNVGAALGADAGLKYSGEYEKGELADQESKIKQSGLRANQALKELSTIDNQAYGIAKQKDAQKQQTELFNKAEEGRNSRFSQGEAGINSRFSQAQANANERARLAREKPSGLEASLGPEGAKDYFETKKATSEASRKKLESVSPDAAKTHVGAISSLRTYSDLAKSRAATDPKQVEALSRSFKEAIANAEAGATFSPERIFNDVVARNKLDPNSPSGQFFKKILIVGRANAIAQAGVATNQDVEQEVSNLMPSYLENDKTYLKRLGWLAERTKQKAASTLDTEVKQGRIGGKVLMEDLDNLYNELGFGEPSQAGETKSRAEFFKEYFAAKKAAGVK